ncbi:hypothetical protein LPUS_08102 [Lasallia pustulata]|uniref:Uncharacterized protein n=1 Tax=Lasallia pustulata TaxID=136370 RepID=A0A1W5D541_9LECA|nr:hypothetical protein LPUS_08102 [Lasallia pustulata]
MRLPLFGPLFMSLAFDQALAAPSSSDWIHRQQGNSKLQNGHLFRRDNGTVSLYSSTSSIRATTVASASFVTLVAPSPGASAISIISQGQIITSYAPLTVCPKTAPSSRPTAVSPYSPAVPALMPSAHVVSPALFNTTAQVARRRVPALYGNATNTPVPSVPHAPLPSCSVTYIPSTTPICHTTLTPLGGLPVPISACDQNITFSTDHGMASTAGSAELLATYYVVPWQDAAGGVPTGIVDAEICNPASQCSTVQERWRISTVTVTKTQTNTLSVNTVVTGPALVILAPTSTLTITDSTPSTISTSLTYEVYATSTSLEVVKQTLSGAMTPKQTSAVSPSTPITSTRTSTRTVTLQGATQTVTI